MIADATEQSSVICICRALGVLVQNSLSRGETDRFGMPRQLLKADFFWPLATLGLVAIAVLVALVLSLVHQFDSLSREREQALVANGLTGITSEIAHRVVPQTVWDEAVRNLDNRFDPVWASENIGQYLSQTNGFDTSFVLDAGDRAIFAADGPKAVDASVFEAFGPATAGVIASVRAQESARALVNQRRSTPGQIPGPIQASSIAKVNGRLYIVSATLVQSDFGYARPKGPKAPIVVTGMELGQPFLKQFSERFMLTNLHVHGDDSRSDKRQAHIPLRALSGEYLATLDWEPQTPGKTMLGQVGGPILIIVGLLSLAALMLYRRVSGMAQSLLASEARATHLAYFDPLTGLPNRTRFQERLDHALDHLRRDHEATVAVHSIDLDRFKEINDLHGHQVGDQLIKLAARRLAAVCRSTDTFARFGADEFAIVQANATAAQAAALADRLIEAMTAPFYLETIRSFIGCSIGITMITDGDVDPGEAIRQADMALTRARADGGSRFCFFEIEMDAAVKTRRSLEIDLREALAAGALEMAYQPQVNHRGVMTGVEALVRWRHPIRGSISPEYFVPIAEECGLISELGLFTIARAFQDSRRWKGLKVAINVSAIQLRTPGFVTAVSTLVSRLRVDPRRFELEITETVLIGDDPETHETLKRLRDLGFSLALDDFGTGYSSLSYLKRFPISKIKIDRSFIANLGIDDEADAVVGAIIRLARALKLNVIAEGVETSEQRDRLAAAGCSEIQGYLFSKPVSAADIEALRAAPTPMRTARAAA
ncbi:COG5001 Predicted signal transduction protein containing a membrane domain, an EAL and a GGDEF domain [Caulobacteraceae bacterium]